MNFKEFAKNLQCIWLSPKQVAKLMQCSIEHIYDLVKAGKICYIKDGKNIRFKPEDLDDYEKHSYVRRKHVTLPRKRL
jgi:excisionase family DNA binding protein